MKKIAQVLALLTVALAAAGCSSPGQSQANSDRVRTGYTVGATDVAELSPTHATVGWTMSNSSVAETF